ncbi:MAG TPA: LPXTG cell wall anchor domain-containing protein, partial [Thermomicrobiales bacterium]|nr:LPXTG cell wall anchor domain-containing protein [Thermomicrobiales bacterium]
EAASNPEGTQRFAQVTDLPETGTGSSQSTATLLVLAIAASILLSLAILSRLHGHERRGP